jgi:hypothetical protein
MISDVEAFLSDGKWLAEAGSSSGRAGGGATIQRACGIRGFAVGHPASLPKRDLLRHNVQ